MKTQKLLSIIAILLCLASCKKEENQNPFNQNPFGQDSFNQNGANSTPSYVETDDQNINNVQNLDVNISNDVELNFENQTIPSDESADDFEDYLENSSFENDTVFIYYKGDKAEFDLNGKSGIDISVDGAKVTVRAIKKACYKLSGNSSDGNFKLYNDEKKSLIVLDNLQLESKNSSCINVQSKKRCFLYLPKNSNNKLKDAVSYTLDSSEDEKACLFSEGQLLISGFGSLIIDANYKHAICSDEYVFVRQNARIIVENAPKDGIHTNEKYIQNGGLFSYIGYGDAVEVEDDDATINFVDGVFQAQLLGTAAKGLKAKSNITISGGQIEIVSESEAEFDSSDNDITSSSCIKSDADVLINGGIINLKATKNAGKGINCDGKLQICDGQITVVTLGAQYVYSRNISSSAKGIKADGDLQISGGKINIKTIGGEGSEGLESKSILTIDNGEIYIYSYDDAINAKNQININGGNIFCWSSSNDGIDSNGTLNISGGVAVSVGSNVPEEGFDCDQNTFKITGGTILGLGGAASTPTSNVCTQNSIILGTNSISENQEIVIKNNDGTEIFSYICPRSFNQMTLLFSSKDLALNQQYNIFAGSNNLAQITVNNVVTTNGNVSSGPGNMGGNPGGMPNRPW